MNVLIGYFLFSIDLIFNHSMSCKKPFDLQILEIKNSINLSTCL